METKGGGCGLRLGSLADMTQRAPLDTVSAGEFIGRNVDLLYTARAELGRMKRSSRGPWHAAPPPPKNSRMISDPALSIRYKRTQHRPSLGPDSLLAQPPGQGAAGDDRAARRPLLVTAAGPTEAKGRNRAAFHT